MRTIAFASGPSLARRAWTSLRRSVRRPVARLNQRDDRPGLDRRIDLERAGHDEAGLVGDRQRLQRVLLEERANRLGQGGGRLRLGSKGT